MTTTKEELEKKIEEKAKRKCDNTDDRNLFIDGANSLEAKAKWQHGLYTEEEVFELLKNSHFVDVNIIEWFELNKKKS